MTATNTEIENWTVTATKDAMARTYASVQLAIDDSKELQVREIETFLQGSYANATNISGDADVDIVVMLKSSWIADTSLLNAGEKLAYDKDHRTVSYGAAALRLDTVAALNKYFGSNRVDPKDKCIRVAKVANYVDADVVPAIQHRIYISYDSQTKGRYVEGVKIYTQKGPIIINFPKEHKKNGINKNSATNNNFKPTVRQLKHLKRRAVKSGRLEQKATPGYLLECITYNVPDDVFIDDHSGRLTGTLSWLLKANLSSFKSVDNIHELFKDDPGNFSDTIAKSVIVSLAEELVS